MHSIFYTVSLLFDNLGNRGRKSTSLAKVGRTHNSSLPPNPQGSFSFLGFPLFFAFHPFFLAVRLSFSLATWEQKNLYKMRLTLEQKKCTVVASSVQAFFCLCFIDIDGRILFSGKWEGMRQSEHFPKAINDAIMASLLFFLFPGKRVMQIGVAAVGKRRLSPSLKIALWWREMWETHACDLKGEKRKRGNGKHFVWTDELREDEEKHSFPESYATCFPAKKIAGVFSCQFVKLSHVRTVVSPQLTHVCCCCIFPLFFSVRYLTQKRRILFCRPVAHNGPGQEFEKRRKRKGQN